MFFKKTTVPVSNETKKIDSVQTWEVRWHSRYGQWQGNVQKEIEVFLSKEDAKEFKTSLENAYKLLRHTSGTEVEILKGKSF